MDRMTAVVPATDAPVTLRACLTAIEAAAEPPEEVIVVSEPARLGPAAARNRGADRATGDLLVFVDADVAVHSDAFARMRRAFVDDSELAAIFGSYDDSPTAGGVVSVFRNLLHHYVHGQGAGVASTFWAGLGAIRSDVFRELGGFDEQRYPNPSIEDIELGARLHARGGSIVLDPAIRGKHLKRWTLISMIRTDLVDRGVPWAELVLARRVDARALNLGPRHRLSALASVAVVGSLVTRRGRSAAGATAMLALLNRDFYLLLLRRRGARYVGAGMLLHIVHHLTGVAAGAVAVARHARARVRRSSRL